MNKNLLIATWLSLMLFCTAQGVVAQLYPTCTINATTGQPNPTLVGLPVSFTVVFNHAVNPATFTVANVSTAGSTATGITINAVAQSVPFDGTTFLVSITATGAGTIVATIPASVYTSTTTALVTLSTRLQDANTSSYGMCMDASSNFYSVWTGGASIAKTTSAGGVSTFIGTSTFASILAYNNGFVYYHASGVAGNYVGRISTAGTLSATWGVAPGILGTANNNMVFDAAGDVFTVYATNRIAKIPAAGGTGTQLIILAAHALVVDASDNLLAVVSGTLYKIDKTTVNTKTAFGTGGSGTATGMYVDPFGNIYATTDAVTGPNLYKWSAAGGAAVASWTLPNESFQITGDAGGAIFIACGTPSNTLYRITPDGATNSYLYAGTNNVYSVFANPANTPTSSTYYTYDFNGNNSGDITKYVLAQTAGITDPAGYGNLASASSNNTVTIETVLPVTITSFIGSANGCTANLVWKTASEVNSARYDVEASLDGTSFSKVGAVASKNSTTGASYTFAYPLVSGTSFCRLKAVDFDGKSAYSAIVAVTGTGACSLGTSVKISPNPTSNIATISGLASGNTISLYGINGQVLKRVMATGTNQSIDLNMLAKGVYILGVQGLDGKTSNMKVIKY